MEIRRATRSYGDHTTSPARQPSLEEHVRLHSLGLANLVTEEVEVAAFVSLQDVRGASRVDFKPAIRTEWLELRIKDVYGGSRYKDTAISELYPVFAD